MCFRNRSTEFHLCLLLCSKDAEELLKHIQQIQVMQTGTTQATFNTLYWSFSKKEISEYCYSNQGFYVLLFFSYKMLDMFHAGIHNTADSRIPPFCYFHSLSQSFAWTDPFNANTPTVGVGSRSALHTRDCRFLPSPTAQNGILIWLLCAIYLRHTVILGSCQTTDWHIDFYNPKGSTNHKHWFLFIYFFWCSLFN